MHSISTNHPLQILKELEQSCKQHLVTPAKPAAKAKLWSGFGFRVNKFNLCIKCNVIEELLDSHFQQNLSKVPGAKNWLMGLISLRGQALPLIDLNQYIFNTSSELTKKSRLLVINFSNTRTGLIIDEAYGLKQFDPDFAQTPASVDTVPAELEKFSTKIFLQGELPWIEFSTQRLENDPDFLNAARF